MFFVEKLKFGRNLFKLWLHYSLPRVKLHEKKKTKKLNNLPSNFEKNFYKNWAEEIDGVINSDFQRKVIFEMVNEDVRNYLLATTEFGQEIVCYRFVHSKQAQPGKFSKKIRSSSKKYHYKSESTKTCFQTYQSL